MQQDVKLQELKRVIHFHIIPKYTDIYKKKGGVKLQKAISLAVEYKHTFNSGTLIQISKLNKNLHAEIYSEIVKSFSNFIKP